MARELVPGGEQVTFEIRRVVVELCDQSRVPEGVFELFGVSDAVARQVLGDLDEGQAFGNGDAERIDVARDEPVQYLHRGERL